MSAIGYKASVSSWGWTDENGGRASGRMGPAPFRVWRVCDADSNHVMFVTLPRDVDAVDALCVATGAVSAMESLR